MKSWTLIVSYLWRDTWSRWWEQPSSVLARLFVGAMLVTVATVILVSLTLLERSVRSRLENFGLNTVILREMLNFSDPELMPNSPRPDRLAPLNDFGQKLRIRQLYPRAQTEFRNDLMVYSYLPDALPVLGQWLVSDTPFLILSDSLPEYARVQITMNKQRAVAIVRKPGPLFRPVVADNVLLVPQGWLPEVERPGFIETTIFLREEDSISVKKVIDSVQLLYSLDTRTPPQVQSALPMIRELEELQSRQTQWRAALASILGIALALVYGAIAVLEFRQNLYIAALLRSFGTPSKYLYLRQWIENAFLANVAAVGAIALIATVHTPLFSALGFSRTVVKFGASNPYWSTEIVLILICVNLGAFLSSLPVAVGLKRPVGEILS